jgi:hypothetical protein
MVIFICLVLNENQIQGVLNKPWLLAMIVKLIKECCPQVKGERQIFML